jgi:hypothetical protein
MSGVTTLRKFRDLWERGDRREAAEMDAWLQRRGVTLVGADLDESPMAYRRLPEVLAYYAASIGAEAAQRRSGPPCPATQRTAGRGRLAKPYGR